MNQLIVLLLLGAAAQAGIIVRTDVPYGNAANVRILETDTGREVRFTPDPHGGPECLWFCFRVCQEKPEAGLGKLRLILECPETMLGGGPANFRPVYRLDGGDWERADAPVLIKLPDGRAQTAWTLDAAAPALDFAFAYPYGPEDIERLIRNTGSYWRSDTLGVSQAGRPLVRLRTGRKITSVFVLSTHIARAYSSGWAETRQTRWGDWQ